MRENPNRFLICRLNHSATTAPSFTHMFYSKVSSWNQCDYIWIKNAFDTIAGLAGRKDRSHSRRIAGYEPHCKTRDKVLSEFTSPRLWRFKWHGVCKHQRNDQRGTAGDFAKQNGAYMRCQIPVENAFLEMQNLFPVKSFKEFKFLFSLIMNKIL